MKAYKGFTKDMKCRGFQFEEGKTYEEENAELCKCGFHACEDPLDVFQYYHPVDGCEYRVVELDGVSSEREDGDTKVCAKKIKVGAKISIRDMIKASVDFSINKAKELYTGASSSHASTGAYSRHASTGAYSRHASTGDSSSHASTGAYSRHESSGKNCVIACLGNGGKVKAAVGNWVTLAEWKWTDGECMPVAVVTKQVDGEIIKPDVWYTLNDGEFVEVK